MAKIKILPEDRLKQADAARLLHCSRQRIFDRINQGSLDYTVCKHPSGKSVRYVSLKQVKALMVAIQRQPKLPDAP
jgi:hypothetical protein